MEVTIFPFHPGSSQKAYTTAKCEDSATAGAEQLVSVCDTKGTRVCCRIVV